MFLIVKKSDHYYRGRHDVGKLTPQSINLTH